MTKKVLRIGVTGGRDFSDRGMIARALRDLPRDAILVHGAARGADLIAAHYWDLTLKRKTEPHPADWGKYGKAAGVIRNGEMVKSGLDLLIAFPGGKGTADMIAQCRAAGIPIRVAQ